MDIQVIGMICAAIGVVSTVVYYVFKHREIRALEAIRDQLKEK